MALYVWLNNSGSFSDPASWNLAAVPGAADTAQFNANSGTISGNGTVAALLLTGGGPWTWTGQLTASGYTVNDTDTLSGAGAVWTIGGTPASGNYMVIGSGSGGAGGLTVTNGASITSTQAASVAAYAIYVGSGSASNATGRLTVSGTGSSVNSGANGATVGQAGTGVLAVEAGASATFASSDSTQISALSVARNAGSNGTVSVTGTGSSLTASGYVSIGRGGAGTLNVTGGAMFTGGVAGSGVGIGDSSSASSTTQYFGGSGTAQVMSGSTLHSLGSLNVGDNGSTGSLTADGAGTTVTADAGLAIGGGTTRSGGTGTLTAQNGATVRAGTPAIGNASVAIGTGMAGQNGTVTVTGIGSLLDANGYRLSIGTGTTVAGVTQSGGTGSLTISNGGKVLSGSNYSDTEAALALGVYASGSGTLTISGAGSSLVANGIAVVGGGDGGSGVKQGGIGTISVTGGGLLQTGVMTIFGGSSVTVDQASTLTAPAITISGGIADLYTLSASSNAGPIPFINFDKSGLLRVHAVSGNSPIGGFGFGDVIDIVGTTNVTINSGDIIVSGGKLALGAAPAGANYQSFSDGNGGTYVALEPQTIGVYRFFDTKFGTHFYTADPTEAAYVTANRPDLTPEGPGGVGLQAVSTAANDPNAAPVYRFFDTLHGTHFFTASASERDSLIAFRPDLTYEASSTFYEHTTQQTGDIPVYRFFDKIYGTHFYTDSATEYASITSARPDLVYEGIGFYEPPKNNALVGT